MEIKREHASLFKNYTKCHVTQSFVSNSMLRDGVWNSDLHVPDQEARWPGCA